MQVLLDETGARPAVAPRPAGRDQPARGSCRCCRTPWIRPWRTHAGHALTLADYERTGGIEGAVAASAQRALGQADPGSAGGGQASVHPAGRDQRDGADTASGSPALTFGGQGPRRDEDVDAVVEEFAAVRLLVLDADTVEISHEALLTAWPLLRDDWLAGARADRMVRTRLQATAQEWILDSRDPSYLYTGSRAGRCRRSGFPDRGRPPPYAAGPG